MMANMAVENGRLTLQHNGYNNEVCTVRPSCKKGWNIVSAIVLAIFKMQVVLCNLCECVSRSSQCMSQVFLQ